MLYGWENDILSDHCVQMCTTASLFCLAPSLALGWGGYKKIWMETEMCEYPSRLSLSLIFFRPFLRIARSFLPSILRVSATFVLFFGFVFCFFLFGFCLRKFSLIPSSHLGASSSGRIYKFCIKKNSVKISLLLVCVYLFLGVFFFPFLWGLLALSSLRFWFLGSCGCWRLFWQRCFIIILLCAFLSRFIHLASDLDRKLSSRSIILH